MRSLLLLVLAATCLCAVADEAVLTLDESNFDSTIESNSLTLVEFYAPWCGHCKSLAPEYEAAAAALAGKNKGVLAKVDCTKEQTLCSRFSVNGFPTLKLFRQSGGDPAPYDGARKSDSIVKFMHKQSAPAVTSLSSAAAVREFSQVEKVTIVGFTRTSAESEQFAAVAQKLRNEFMFGTVSDLPAVEQEFEVTAPAVLLFRDFDSKPAVFTGDFAAADLADQITKFIRVHSFPSLGAISPDNYQKYMERGFNLVWVFHNLNDEDHATMLTEVVEPVAKDFNDRLSFVHLDGVKWVEHAKSFGLSGELPGIAIEDRKARKNFVFPSDTPTAESLRTWVQTFVDGTLQPTVKSQPIPESNNGPVKVIVGHTFNEIVMDASKNVLVEFYAPWCGHCKQLAPKYDELGKKFADEKDVVIAKIDSTANDSPAEIKGFPTLLFYPAGAENKAHPVQFSGDRTVSDMERFVRTHMKAAGKHDEL